MSTEPGQLQRDMNTPRLTGSRIGLADEVSRGSFLAAALAITASRPLEPAGAQTEGGLVWYSSLDAQTFNQLVGLFNATHPRIALSAVQLSDEHLLARVKTEHTAGARIADVITSDQIGFNQLVEAGLIAPLRLAEKAGFLPGTFDAQNRYVAWFSFTDVLAWNPERLKSDGLRAPDSLVDFTKPEWRGKFAIDANAFTWFAGLVATEPNAHRLLEQLAANKPVITPGHSATISQLVAGEFDATPTAYGYMTQRAVLEGRPIAFLNPRPVTLSLNLAGVLKDAPHPAAARVLVEWLLSKPAQEFVAHTERTPMRTDVRNDPRVFSPTMPYHVLPIPTLDQYNRLVTEFRGILGIAS